MSLAAQILTAFCVAAPLLCGVPVTTATTTSSKTIEATSASTVTSYGSYSYAGCVIDSVSKRVLSSLVLSTSTLSAAGCISACSSKKFSYAGVESGSLCYCGNKPSYLTSATICTMTCAGSSHQYCGGNNALDLYAIKGAVITIPALTTSTSIFAKPSSTSTVPTSTSKSLSSSSSSSQATISSTTSSTPISSSKISSSSSSSSASSFATPSSAISVPSSVSATINAASSSSSSSASASSASAASSSASSTSSSLSSSSSSTPSVAITSTSLSSSQSSSLSSSFSSPPLSSLSSSSSSSSSWFSSFSSTSSLSSSSSSFSSPSLGSLSSSSSSSSSWSSSFSSSSSLSSSSSSLSSSSSSSLSSSSSNLVSSSSSSSNLASASSSSTILGSSSTAFSSSASASASVVPLSGNSVASTVLILGTSSEDISTASYVLNGYGIPFEGYIVGLTGFTLPVLNTTTTLGGLVGNYGLIVVQGQVSLDYGNDVWASAMSDAQWQSLYDYQEEFGVRMIQLNVYPGSEFGTVALGGCCDAADDQNVTILTGALSRFPNAGLNVAPLSMFDLWHYPATVSDTNATETTPFIQFNANALYPDAVGGVINTYATRQQMVFFTSFGTWSATSTFLSHIWIQWGTRGLYSGMRRAVLGTQIDDLLLETEIYTNSTATYRLTVADLQNHATYTTNLNSRLAATNPGSFHFFEFGYNGNGNLLEGQLLDEAETICKIDPINYNSPYEDNVALEYIKPLGSGTSVWPTKPSTFDGYTLACMKLDPVTLWLMTPTNRDNFAFVTHTYSHLSLDNATYADTYKEFHWNIQWANTTGISSALHFSGNGLIPPAITGLHNGDALQAMWNNGLRNCVGDNTRPVLRNSNNPMWPVMTNVSENGFDGFQITPRFATRIYYNCDSTYCTVTEWIATSAGAAGDIQTVLGLEKASTSNQLLGLYHDPYMFHQANLRSTGINATLVNGSLQTLSLIQIWVETNTAEFQRVANWPLISLKHDDIAASFKARMVRDACSPNINLIISNGSITGFQVTTTGNTCSTNIPVTVPGTVTSTQGMTTEQLGNDPLTIWVTMSGSPVSFALTSPISLSAL